VYGKYPVFIVGAEGGGLYAASAAALLLARLQDTDPRFSEHVFAISGVSGGAIGATIFRALDHGAHPDMTAASNGAAYQENQCANPKTAQQQNSNSLEQRVANILQDDHFSPVVGSIVPAIFGAPLTRSDALAASLEYSTSAQDPVAGEELCAPFAQQWSTAATSPALVLNSTWIETGFRAAFAPFNLHDLDESLYSFADAAMPDVSNIRLMDAAVVTARSPFVFPPYSVRMSGGKRWNFIDGGYSDISGATTALDLYEALERAVPDVDLRVILITSSNPQPNLSDSSISGTAAVVPIDAFVKMREELGTKAVARACSEIYADRGSVKQSIEVNETCIEHAGSADGPLQIVEIQDQTYGLSSAFKISQTTFGVESWILGEPQACASMTQTVGPSNDENAQLTSTIFLRNSCVSKLILNLIRESSVPATNGP
jgi:hypothetical protein